MNSEKKIIWKFEQGSIGKGQIFLEKVTIYIADNEFWNKFEV